MQSSLIFICYVIIQFGYTFIPDRLFYKKIKRARTKTKVFSTFMNIFMQLYFRMQYILKHYSILCRLNINGSQSFNYLYVYYIVVDNIKIF
jgi:hypothetical protein